MPSVIANGEAVTTSLPCSLENFLISRDILPNSVVVEWNGKAITHSEFSELMLTDGDRIEIVRIVAGG